MDERYRAGLHCPASTAVQQLAAAQERPMTRLESLFISLKKCASEQAELNERLVGLTNGLWGVPPPICGTDKGNASSLPYGLAEELDGVVGEIAQLQSYTDELITRLSAAIPDRR